MVSHHDAYLVAGSEVVDTMPGGRAWREALEELAAPDERQLISHEGHVTHLSARDLALLEHAGDGMTVRGDADEIRTRLEGLAERGVQEVIYTPSGPDVARELQAFHAAAADRRN